ncbi:MAG TPA: M17 family peptidase N-terminal domain-containing protein, partial [Thermomicrobiales bacterium]|nr:M17 family peptidase N-terminal domain-containing protein [Thermomicrobiales bacterium]
MEIAFRRGAAPDDSAGALIVPVAADEGDVASSPIVRDLDRRLSGHLAALVADAGFTGKAGSTLTVPTLGQLPAARLIFVGIGAADGATAAALTRSYGAAALAAREAGAKSIAVALPADAALAAPAAVEAAALGLRLASYRFTRHRGAGRPSERPEIEQATIMAADLTPEAGDAAVRRAASVADAVSLARDLVNEPASVLTPQRMAEIAADIASKSGLAIEILDEAALAKLGANAILAVGMGSAHKPRLIRLRYTPRQPDASNGRVVGLVGKCITFDTGGYSIKTYEGMLEMKGDMAGGAAVLGVMSALSVLGCDVPVEATICAAENMISGESFRPGDIITPLNGVTIEVLSTDAEGRLVLADGLVDTARRGATELIDLATLTGAAVVALGEGTTALFSSDDDLAASLLAAAAEAG